MKKVLAFIMVVAMCVCAAPAQAWNELVIADFDTGDKPNNLGGDFGAWDKDPNDSSQFCEVSFEYGADALGEPAGYALRMTYDVDSPSPAYNGFWTKLEGEDFSGYNTLNIYVKGDKAKGFTKKMKIEIKNYQKSASYILSGISDSWQKISIPFEKFRGVDDWSSMSEMVFVFDDINSSPKEGALLIDHVTVSKE